MKKRREYILMASDLALRTRMALGYNPRTSLCVYDAAEKLGIELRFDGNPGLEGVYIKASTPKIIIGAHRPTGRKVFTCAHELGHHVFNHGTKIDEVKPDSLSNNSSDMEEFLADSFACMFLMPKSAITRAFTFRGWSPTECSPVEFITIAGWCGVSYEAIINQLSSTLKMIPFTQAEDLKRTRPKEIRSILMGREVKEDVVLVDYFWNEKAIDLQVGDFVILPFNTKFESKCKCVEYTKNGKRGAIYRGITPGTGRFYITGKNWSSFVRVCRRNYVGRSIYRHLEEVEDEK